MSEDMVLKSHLIRQAFDLAFGKGKVKQWAFQSLLIDKLYIANKTDNTFIKLKDISNIKADLETEDEIILKFGFKYRIPRTEVDLHIRKKNHLMYLTKEGLGLGYEDVEKVIFDFLKEQKQKDNLYWHTNYNWEEYKIK